MNILTKAAIGGTALFAIALAPISGAVAANKYGHPPSGNHYVHKGGHGYYKNKPRVAYPRGYHKHKPPVVVHKHKGNGAALGIIGFAAGAMLGNALAR